MKFSLKISPPSPSWSLVFSFWIFLSHSFRWYHGKFLSWKNSLSPCQKNLRWSLLWDVTKRRLVVTDVSVQPTVRQRSEGLIYIAAETSNLASDGTRRFNTVLKTAHNLTISWTRWIRSTFLHPKTVYCQQISQRILLAINSFMYI